jgi:methyl-accepting chemotaxis protein
MEQVTEMDATRSFWSITRKLLAVAGAIVTVGFMAVAGTLLDGQRAELREGARREGRMMVNLLGAQMSGGLRWKKPDAVEATYAELVKEEGSTVASILVLDDAGQELVSYSSESLRAVDLSGIGGDDVPSGEARILRESDGAIVVGTAVVAGKQNERVGTLLVAISLEPVEATIWRTLLVNGAISLGMLVVILAVLGLVASRIVGRPLVAMTELMGQLAAGNTDIEVPGLDRGDEVGAMARSVQVFKNSMIEAERLRGEQERLKAEAAAERKAALERTAAAFEESVGSIVGAVASASTEMEGAAQSLSATAEEASRQATVVSSAATQASANVQTVATAAEQLSASIGEIARQVTQSSRIATQAVEEAERTNETVQSLAQAAEKIGAVVGLIQDIAGQTNLLALNATIEAARAGEAGKGFAVVANEVKALATQTAKATDEIAAQIGAIQGATGEAVTAIRHIGGTIEQLNEIAGAIASAVEEQGAATREIAGNVQQAATGTSEVSSNIAGLTQASGDVGAAATQVFTASTELSRQSDRLKQELAEFLDKLRAA